jgi:hypothetical protein
MPGAVRTVYTKINIAFIADENDSTDCSEDTIYFLSNLQDTTYKISSE